MSRGATALLAASLALACPSAGTASGVVIYRCVAADGAVILQNGRRCPKGTQEQRRRLEAPSAPAPVALPPVAPARPAPTSPAPATAPAVAPVIEIPPAPAPELFACRTWDGARYFGDDAAPAPRCAPLETVGLDGGASPGQACEVMPDTCEPVPEAARCEAWAERLRQAEGTARFGDADVAGRAGEDAGRIRAALAGTVCAR